MKKVGEIAAVFTAVLIITMLFSGCSDNPLGLSDADLSQRMRGRPVSVTSEDPDEGNNLSLPVIWSDRVTLPLRGTFGADMWGGASTYIGGTLYYHQKDPLNSWQAASYTPPAGTTISVDRIDWGDNLEVKAWPAGATVRVETVLYDTLPEPGKTYAMEWIQGHGVDEVWGADRTSFMATNATVYAHCARLTIQRLGIGPEDPPGSAVVSWDTDTAQWTGNVETPIFDKGVWGGGDPSGKYSAEVNVQGKVIFGFNWRVPEVPGWYRITFSLDGTDYTGTKNTDFDSSTSIMYFEGGEEEVSLLSAPGNGPGSGPGGNGGQPPMLTGQRPQLLHEKDLTYIDVLIVESRGGRR